MAVTVDTATENVRTGTTSPQTFSHAGAASGVKGVVVAIVHGTSSTDHVSAVSYGGVALTRVQRNVDTATEPGAAELWFLGASVPQGTQTVSYTPGATTDDIHCVCITLLAAADLESIDNDGVSENVANPSVTLQYSGRSAMAFAALYGGGASPASFAPNANCTAVHDEDLGAFYSSVIRQTTAGTADFAIGGTSGTDDVAFAAIAVAEVANNIVATPGTASLTLTGFAPTVSVSDHKVATPGTASLALTSFAPTVTTTELLDGLEAWWKCDESSGNLVDAHSTHDLTDTNTVGSASGKIGGARDFEATNEEYFTTSDSTFSIPDTGTSYEFAFWVRFESPVADYQQVITKRTVTQTGSGLEYMIRVDFGTVYLYWGRSGSPDYDSIFWSTPLSAGVWYFVSFGYDGSTNKFFLQVNNGTPVESAAKTDQTIAGSNPFQIGGSGVANEYLDGLLDLAGFWKNRVLTAQNRTELYNSGSGLDYGFDPETATPGAASLTLTSFAPTVSVTDNQIVTPDAASLAISAFAPTVTATEGTVATPGAASLATETFAPTVSVSDNKSVVPDPASLTTTGFAPTVTASDHKTVTPSPASLETTTFAPTVTASANQTATPGTASLVLTTFSPSIGVGDAVEVVPDPGALTLTAFAPSVNLSDHKVVTPDAGSLVLTAFEPVVTASDHRLVIPGVGTLTLQGFEPSVSTTAHIVATPQTASLVLTAYAPDVGFAPPPEPGANYYRRVILGRR